MHSNLQLASRRGPEYGSGPSKERHVDLKSLDLELSLAAMNIEDQEHRSGIGQFLFQLHHPLMSMLLIFFF